ncbi:MAG: hypothetical protein V1818_01755 [Candidatus Aenigmatarchaeota archaeon]
MCNECYVDIRLSPGTNLKECGDKLIKLGLASYYQPYKPTSEKNYILDAKIDVESLVAIRNLPEVERASVKF